MMQIYIARHGQTQWNTEHRTQGRTDIPLDATGRAQAAALAKRLADTPFCAIYASPLLRAYDTALAVAQATHVPLIRDERLLEREFGAWEGVAFAQLREQFPDIWQQWMEDPYAAQPPLAEPMAEVRARCADFIAFLTEQHAHTDTVLVVCHSISARMIIALLTGLAPQRLHDIPLDNVGFTVISLEDGRGTILTRNDSAHWKGEL